MIIPDINLLIYAHTDAQLAALAAEHQATLHSCDADFSRFPGLRWHNPLTG